MNQSPHKRPDIACFGEILWDSTPRGLFLGGAPFNVAYHLSKLKRNPLLISSVGNDDLGKLAIQKAKGAKIDTACIQVNDEAPTGITDIKIDDNRDATYDIRKPAAWDQINWLEPIQTKIKSCKTLVFGTLAARSETSKNTLFKILDTYDGLTVCDVNLRKPFHSIEFVLAIASRAEVIKLNTDELHQLLQDEEHSLSLEKALSQLMDLTKASMLFVTRGKDSAIFFDGNRLIFASPPSKLEADGDTIGAGDAFTAAIVNDLISDTDIDQCLRNGVNLGSYVATQSGAQPDYAVEDVLSSNN